MKIPNNELIEIPSNKIYLNDKFARKSEVLNVVELVTKLSNPCTIAIDSSWGTGKTTFLKFLEAELNNREVKVSYFNAWENDFDREPFLLILNHIVEQFSENNDEIKEIKKIAINVLRSIVVNGSKSIIDFIAPFKISDRLTDLSDEIASTLASEVFDNFNKEEKEIKLLQDKLSSLISEKSKMVILVDEMDRCRPIFSIDLLERIKHIFNTPNIIFILGTDLEQLGKAISGVYGESYNGKKYLERFFDIEFNLNTPDYEEFWNSIVKSYTGKSSIDSMKNQHIILSYGLWFTNHLQLSARDIKRLYIRIYLASLSEYACDNLPLIILLSVIKNYSKHLYTSIKLKTFDLDEIFDLIKISDTNLVQTRDGTTQEFFVLIHNLLLDESDVESSEIVELLVSKFNNPNMVFFIKNSIARYKDSKELLIDNLASVFKAVDLQGISHNQYAEVYSSVHTKIGSGTTISSN